MKKSEQLEKHIEFMERIAVSASKKVERTYTRLGKEYKREFSDTATANKIAEYVIRPMLRKKNIMVESDFTIHPAYMPDFVIIINGKRYNGEIKTGGGEVGFIENFPHKARFEKEDIQECNLCIGWDLIAYTPVPREIDFSDEDDVLDNVYMFTREEFIEFVIANSGKRKHGVRTAFKLGNQYGTRINIQSPYLQQLNDALQTSDYPTLRTFLESIGRLK